MCERREHFYSVFLLLTDKKEGKNNKEIDKKRNSWRCKGRFLSKKRREKREKQSTETEGKLLKNK